MESQTDLAHFLDDRGYVDDEAPGPTRKLGAYLASIVACATAGGRAETWTTMVRCRRRPKHRPCPGQIRVRLIDVPLKVFWDCPSCGDEGTITNFSMTAYDFSGCCDLDGPCLVLRTSKAEQAALLSGIALDIDQQGLVYGAPTVDDEVSITIPVNEAEMFADALAADANHCRDGASQTLLCAVFRRLIDRIEGDATADPAPKFSRRTTDAEDTVVGAWRITKMELWALDAVEMEGPGIFAFDTNHFGAFRFIAVTGEMDWRRDGDRIDFSWRGDDDGHPVHGRGWARIDGDELAGCIFFFAGDESTFNAKRSQVF